MDVALLKGRREDAIESAQGKIEKINRNQENYKRTNPSLLQSPVSAV
jgi:hypothetical protein